jgi:hypothetical protein
MKNKAAWILWFAIATCLTAFAGEHPESHGQSASSFKNTVWHVDCRKCNKETTGRDFTPYYMFLNGDGFVGYSYEGPSNYDFKSAPATWRISSGKLIIEWKHGDVEKYALTSSQSKTFSGVNQHGLEHVIERVGE